MLVSTLLIGLALPAPAQLPATHPGQLPDGGLAGSISPYPAPYPPLGAPAGPELALTTPAAETVCRDVRLNTFTESSQDSVSLGVAPDGTLITVWHSRRQEDGTYGVRARRLDANGKFLSEEIAVNETREGMQVDPSIGLDASGAAWFAWVSRGQDGDGDGVYTRRFSKALDAASAELRVDEAFAGDQSEPSIVALDDGRALCVWTGPAASQGEENFPGRRSAFARFIDAAGTPSGERITLDVGQGLGVRTPSMVRLHGGALVALAGYDATGHPAGIYVIAVHKKGLVSAPLRMDGAQDGGLPVEPTLCSTDGRAAIAWLESERDRMGSEYSIRWRSLGTTGARRWFARSNHGAGAASALPRLEPGTIHSVEAPGEGYTSGLAIAARGQETAIVWSRYLASESGAPRLFCEVARNDGSRGGGTVTSILAACRASGVEGGKQALAVGGASQRVLLLADGSLVAAWHGDGELGDSSGAHLSFVTLERKDSHTRILATASPNSMESRAAPTTVTYP